MIKVAIALLYGTWALNKKINECEYMNALDWQILVLKSYALSNSRVTLT